MVNRQVKESSWDDNLNPMNVEAAERYNKDQESRGRSLSYLIHRVFKQTEDGQELLSRWREIMEMVAVVEPGLDLGEIGAREGYNRFIRGIIRAIKQVEAGEK